MSDRTEIVGVRWPDDLSDPYVFVSFVKIRGRARFVDSDGETVEAVSGDIVETRVIDDGSFEAWRV